MLINQEAKKNLLLSSEPLHTLPRNLPESNRKALPCGFGNNDSELVSLFKDSYLNFIS